jgi:hypothetical protein
MDSHDVADAKPLWVLAPPKTYSESNLRDGGRLNGRRLELLGALPLHRAHF